MIEVMFDRSGRSCRRLHPPFSRARAPASSLGASRKSRRRRARRHRQGRSTKSKAVWRSISAIIAFLPSSQVEIRPIHNLDAYLGHRDSSSHPEAEPPAGQCSGLAPRAARTKSCRRARRRRLAIIQEGAVVTGTVKNLTDYGAFVDLGGIDGLLHVSDLSYGNVTHPSSVVHVGEQVTVKVLKFDREKERISLGLKQMYSGSLAEHRRTISARQPGNRACRQRHGLWRFRGTGARCGRTDPHLRNDLEPAHETSGQGGRSRATRWKRSCSK